MFTGARDKLVDKCLFITILIQLKADVLVKLPQNYLFKPNYLTLKSQCVGRSKKPLGWIT